ncbi:hypothetical protein BYT27DRAFT_7338509 [Phlegmacium glaucopus]|nr:hypothetical protein BYT27DRAFT_7338509 [Phlegmacium glaucopus]
MSSSLSSVVSNLVRASMGTSISNMVTDDDLDRHVAELIVKEAKKKAERYGQQGIRAYISSNLAESNAPRTNKRFLTSIIKSTDDHNKTVLKAQAAAAQEVKREREEQERRERRARAAEAVEAEKLRRRSKRKRDPEDESWDRWDGRTADRKRTSRSRNWDNWGGYDNDGGGNGDGDDRSRHRKRRRRTGDRSRSRSRERRGDTPSRSSHTKHDPSSSSKRHKTHRTRSRSASPPRKVSRDKGYDRQDESRTSHRRRSRVGRRKRSRSSSCSPSPHKRRKPIRYALDDLRDESLSPRSCSTAIGSECQPRERRSSTSSTTKSYPTPRRDNDPSSKDIDPISSASRHSSPYSRVPSRLSSPDPGPQPPVQLPSKMDRYFEESYDPRLDVAPLSVPKVPATGLINNADFEGWDAMLELIRVRREDKEEKKRLERLGLSKEKVKVKKNVPINSSAAVADRWSSEGVSILDIEYNKRGSVREWDVGKEGF